MDRPLINRVANSGLITIKLEDYYPKQNIVEFDLKDFLFQGLILREKEFRQALKEIDWSQYKDSILLVFCTTDAIIPVWAYMLVAAQAKPFVYNIFHGDKMHFLTYHYKQLVDKMEGESFEGQRIVIKGCSDKAVPESAYLDITAKLQPFAQSIMYGEPCSTVPIFKRPRKLTRS